MKNKAGTKNIYVCKICGLEEHKNRKPVHHVIPRRLNLKNEWRIWLCRGCHAMLHKAEFMGLCILPSSEDEYRDWKKRAGEVFHGKELSDALDMGGEQ